MAPTLLRKPARAVMTAPLMRLLLLPLPIWPLFTATTAAAQAYDSLGDLALDSSVSVAASAPADLPQAAPWQRKLRARGSGPQLEPDGFAALSFLATGESSAAHPALSKEDNELEQEALLIDAELARSGHLISKAWENIRRAPLIPAGIEDIGRHIEQRSTLLRIQDLAESVPVLEWYFFAVSIALVIAMDLIVLQPLPEIERTHVGILVFWVLVSACFCAEVWSTQGQKEGISWASGYLLELIFSIGNIFIFNLVFHTLETPRRLMRKALLVTVVGSIFLRFAFYVGMAEAIYKLTILPYILGAWLIYCGTQQVAVGGRCEEEEATDVTRTTVVRALRWCLGDRLGEFYDEEGEAMFLLSGKKPCMTLLGAAVFCLLTTDLLFGPNATLVKMDLIPNPYVSVSSSIFALFTLRALFFVVRDILSHLSLARYCTGLIILFVGAEMLVARFTEISALMSLIVVLNVIMLMGAFSAVKDSTSSSCMHMPM